MRKYLLIVAAALALVASPAAADWTGKDASGNTITFSNPVDCTIGTCIPIAALVTAAGATLYGTAGTANANVLTVQGIASMTPFLSAQSGTWTVQPGNTANTTPWLMSISQGGNTAVVKAGNTAATTDVAAVVADPNLLAAVNSSIPAGTNLIGDVNLRQGGSALSATNGIFSNLLVGNAAVATGTGSQGATSPRVTVATDQATNAGAALKNGGVGVVNGASSWETIAASQTGQPLGATGAAGDYLSHCMVYPTSTTPGVVTVFDDTSSAANNVIAFPGGASSVSNLVPFAFPVGAISVTGAWKVTTGANLVVTCYGKFT